jgi:hypothetical protein
MRTIGTAVTRVVAQTGPAAASPAPRSSMPALPAKPDPNGIPVRLDRECDIELPRQLFAAWIPDTGPRAVMRALSAEERAKIEARATALEDALKPFTRNDEHAVRASINGLFGGYRAMRQQGQDARAVVDVTMAVLREFPAWAIAQALRKVVCGETKLDRRFAPNDTEIFDVVAGVVRLYRENLRQAKALRDAPVDEPPPRGPSERLAPIRPWPEKAPQRPQLEPITKSRREALMADLAARKIRNDARLDVRADLAEEAPS